MVCEGFEVTSQGVSESASQETGGANNEYSPVAFLKKIF